MTDATDVVAADSSVLQRANEIVSHLPGVSTTRPEGPNTFQVDDPGTGQPIGWLQDRDVEDFKDAVDLADAAARSWTGTTPRCRADILRRAYDRILEMAEDFALLISYEMGKTLADARAEVTYGADFLRWYSEEAQRLGGDFRMSPYGDARLAVTRSPVGICLLITPWNFPLAMATRKVAPALAAGCTAILKPAALTPLTSLLFREVLLEAGLPEGVLTVLPTTRARALSKELMSDRRIRKVSFTGSTEVGQRLLAQAADGVLRTSLELGGNAPFLVFDDADLDRAVSGAIKAKLRNGGQSCIAANRYLVQDGIADAFVAALTESMSGLSIGHGLSGSTDLGPVIDSAAKSRMTELVSMAEADGSTVTLAGGPIDAPGHFVAPTVLDKVSPGARINDEEIFGPVLSVTRFSTLAEAVKIANSTDLGLASYVYTQDLDRAFTVADRLQSGMVGINQPVVSNVSVPFGGVGLSGLGREGGSEGVEEYQNIKLYNIARADAT